MKYSVKIEELGRDGRSWSVNVMAGDVREARDRGIVKAFKRKHAGWHTDNGLFHEVEERWAYWYGQVTVPAPPPQSGWCVSTITNRTRINVEEIS